MAYDSTSIFNLHDYELYWRNIIICRYDNALSKANAAALALKQASEATPEENEEVNDEDEELQANLARARLAAKKKAETRVASTDELLLAAEQRRKEREKQENEQRGTQSPSLAHDASIA